MLKFYNSTIVNEKEIEVKINRLLRSVTIKVDEESVKKVVWHTREFTFSDINVVVKAFPIWEVKIYQGKELLKSNFLPLLRRKSKAYWNGILSLAILKLTFVMIVYFSSL